MVDTCTIRRRTGEATNAETGQIIPTYATLYSGKCRIQQQKEGSVPQNAGEAYIRMLPLQVQLPMSVTGLAVGDEVTVDASVHDGDLPGRVFIVRDLAHKSHATARRVTCEERTS